MAHALLMCLGTRSLSSLCMVSPPVVFPPAVSPLLSEMECLWISIRHYVMHKEKELPKGSRVTTELSQAQPQATFSSITSPQQFALQPQESGSHGSPFCIIHRFQQTPVPAGRQRLVHPVHGSLTAMRERKEGRITLIMGQGVKLDDGDDGDLRERKTES